MTFLTIDEIRIITITTTHCIIYTSTVHLTISVNQYTNRNTVDLTELYSQSRYRLTVEFIDIATSLEVWKTHYKAMINTKHSNE